jgi:16S rRNA (uracil1498-N3)-methyltransferase
VIALLLPPGTARAGERVVLDDDEAHHVRVRRAADGETVRLLDGAGLDGRGTLRFEGKRAAVEVVAVERVAAPAPLTLAVGAGDRERFAWLAEKAAELGVTAIVPVETERAAHVDSRLRAGQVERLQRRAKEALKQSGAVWAPLVHAPVALAAFLTGCDAPVRWLADGGGEPPPVALGPAPLAVLVGPEGGLTDAERSAARASGFHPVALGANILRFETAALAAAVAAGMARARGTEGRSG